MKQKVIVVVMLVGTLLAIAISERLPEKFAGGYFSGMSAKR